MQIGVPSGRHTVHASLDKIEYKIAVVWVGPDEALISFLSASRRCGAIVEASSINASLM
jgi:hypothetical protein